MSTWSPISAAPGGLTPTTGVFSANLAQVAATYDLCTATGGAVLITGITFHDNVAATGLTSVSFATNNTTAVTVLASVVLANLTADKNQTPYTTLLYLPSAKKIQYTIVGTGTAGSMDVIVQYVPLAAGAVLA